MASHAPIGDRVLGQLHKLSPNEQKYLFELSGVWVEELRLPQGRRFESLEETELCNLIQAPKATTLPHTPSFSQGNSEDDLTLPNNPALELIEAPMADDSIQTELSNLLPPLEETEEAPTHKESFSELMSALASSERGLRPELQHLLESEIAPTVKQLPAPTLLTARDPNQSHTEPDTRLRDLSPELPPLPSSHTSPSLLKPIEKPEQDVFFASQAQLGPSSSDTTSPLSLKKGQTKPENPSLDRSRQLIAPLSPGDRLDDRYEILEQVGTGGHAVVFRARQLPINRIVAIKVMRTSIEEVRNQHFRERFLREARMVAQLTHPNVSTIFEYGISKDRERPYLAMEFIEGKALDEILRDHGPMSAGRAIELTLGVLDALAEGHRIGIIHKDLKPANLILNTARGKEHLKVLDFGIALQDGPDLKRLTGDDELVGTAQYVAPEYALHKIVTPAFDVYQVGLILVEMLTGDRVVQAESKMECLLEHTRRLFEIPPLIAHSPIGHIIERALAYDYRQRYQDAAAFQEALVAVNPDEVDAFLAGQTQPLPWWVYLILLLAVIMTATSIITLVVF